MVEKQKMEAMTTKRQRVKERICSSCEKKENYESDTGNETNLD